MRVGWATVRVLFEQLTRAIGINHSSPRDEVELLEPNRRIESFAFRVKQWL